jgi:hypothetical protein
MRWPVLRYELLLLVAHSFPDRLSDRLFKIAHLLMKMRR